MEGARLRVCVYMLGLHVCWYIHICIYISMITYHIDKHTYDNHLPPHHVAHRPDTNVLVTFLVVVSNVTGATGNRRQVALTCDVNCANLKQSSSVN